MFCWCSQDVSIIYSGGSGGQLDVVGLVPSRSGTIYEEDKFFFKSDDL